MVGAIEPLLMTSGRYPSAAPATDTDEDDGDEAQHSGPGCTRHSTQKTATRGRSSGRPRRMLAVSPEGRASLTGLDVEGHHVVVRVHVRA